VQCINSRTGLDHEVLVPKIYRGAIQNVDSTHSANLKNLADENAFVRKTGRRIELNLSGIQRMLSCCPVRRQSEPKLFGRAFRKIDC
jgi:hypothetical protein